MENRGSSMPHDHSHPNPYMQNHNFNSQNRYAANYAQNPSLVETHDFFSQINQNHHGFGGSPGLQNLESAMGRLQLSNPSRNSTNFGLHSGSSYFGTKLGGRATTLNLQNLQDLLSDNTDPIYNSNLSARNFHSHTPNRVMYYNFNSLEDVRGDIVSIAKDQCGCHFLQMKFDEGKPEDIQMILWEVKDHLHELMVHHFGNYLIQKIFGANSVSVEQMDCIVDLVIQNEQRLKAACIDNHGTWAFQKLLENLKTPDQVYAVVFAVKRITVTLTKSVNGGYVIQHFMKLFSPSLTKLILDEVAENCVGIATDRSGCFVIQKCLGYSNGEAMWRLVTEIISNALILAEDQYGNYVVQYLVKMKMPQINASIISQLIGKHVQLSMNKHASNVVEHLLELSEEKHAAIIVMEIMYSQQFLNVLQDPYGNYVAQRALKNSKGTLQKRLVNSVLSNAANLHSHLYGKRVLAFAKRCRMHEKGDKKIA